MYHKIKIRLRLIKITKTKIRQNSNINKNKTKNLLTTRIFKRGLLVGIIRAQGSIVEKLG